MVTSSGSIPSTFPYEAIAVKKYKSPHKNDLSFAKGDRIRVTAFAPKDEDEEEDDEDEEDCWLIGETLDGLKTGTFPAGHVEEAAPVAKEEGEAISNVEPSIVTEKQEEEKDSEIQDTKARDETNQAATTAPAIVSETKSNENEFPINPSKDEPVTTSQPAETIPEKKTSADQIPTPAAVDPPKKPTSPPLAPKPSGLAARIAAFNKPQDAPPPIPRGKPGGGWKPPPPAIGGAKPVMPGPSAAQLNRSTASNRTIPPSTSPSNDAVTSESVVDSQISKVNSGFSAADAQTSIKMSLKERMAALQRNEASSAERETTKPAPKPAPKRIDEDRRTAAMASFAGPSTEEQPKDSVEEGEEGKMERKESEGVEKNSEAIQSPSEETEETELATETAEEPAEEKTEEELESERRAAIAKRMAALGGRRMGGGPGPAMFGAPAPPSKPRQLSTDSRNTNDESKVTKDENITAPIATTTTTTENEPTNQTAEEDVVKSEKMLAVPRRTAPPRKKKSSTSSHAATVGEEKERSNSESIQEEKEQGKEEEGDKQVKEEEKGHSSTAELTAGIGAAAIGTTTILDKGDSVLTDEPQENKDTDSPPEVIEPEQDEDDRGRRQSIQSSKRTDSFEPSTPVSQSELEEHARQLAAFIQTPEVEAQHRQLGEFSRGKEENEDLDDDNLNPTAAINREILSSPPPPANAPPRPPMQRDDDDNDDEGTQRISSPPPTRAPPVPKSSLPPPSQDVDGEDRAISPAPTRPPPIPKSSLPPSGFENDRTTSPPPTRAPPIPTASPAGRRESSLMASIEDIQKSDNVHPTNTSGDTILAAPKPRMAIPTNESDDEEGEEKAEEITQEAPPTKAPVEAPSEELTEEEEERQRRSRLAERMARMGGMPIMGAPMPFRKPPVPVVEPEQEESKEEEPMDTKEEKGEDNEKDPAYDDEDENINIPAEPIPTPHSERAIPPPAPVMSPAPPAPPVPTTSPPPPARSPAQPLVGGNDLTRSGSTRRPPVPNVSHSRGATNEEIAELEAAANPTSPQMPNLTRMASPPALPSSPPPRAPSRPPPGAGLEGEQNRSIDQNLIRRPSKRLSNASSTGMAQKSISSSSGLVGVLPSPPSARDIDLMPSSQWWRHGRPVRLPPTLMRPDVTRNVEVQDEGSNHLIRIDLIFEDYSSTAISVKYQDDDADEQFTQIAQRHNFAPMRPNTQELMSWSQQIGSRIARQASALLTKGSGMQIGDGTSIGFISALIAMSTAGMSLPPVGYSFGSIILAQAATTIVDQGADEIRPGDIIALHGTDFRGKKGLTSYHTTYGSAQEPAFACVIETTFESKKRKVRCILVSSLGNNKTKGGSPEEVSLRLDDIKSGLLRVFRVPPKHGWLPE